jgi:hypothetical protein
MTDNEAFEIAYIAVGLQELIDSGIVPAIEVQSSVDNLLSVSKKVKTCFDDLRSTEGKE